MKSPYVGVTGFASRKEIANFLGKIDLDKTERLIMLGVLMSDRTMQNSPSLHWPNRYPSMDVVKNIFPYDRNLLNLIHFCPGGPESLLEKLVTLTESVENLNGFQLNMTWPDPSVLEKYKKVYPDKIIVLQIGNSAFKQVLESPERLVEKVCVEYADSIDYVLIDGSGGEGKELDPTFMKDCLEEFGGYYSKKFEIVIAGGLGPDTIDLINPIVDYSPYVSIDAECKLRDSNDVLDIEKARTYVQKALEMFRVKTSASEKFCMHRMQSRVLTHRGVHCGDCGKKFP